MEWWWWRGKSTDTGGGASLGLSSVLHIGLLLVFLPVLLIYLFKKKKKICIDAGIRHLINTRYTELEAQSVRANANRHTDNRADRQF